MVSAESKSSPARSLSMERSADAAHGELAADDA